MAKPPSGCLYCLHGFEANLHLMVGLKVLVGHLQASLRLACKSLWESCRLATELVSSVVPEVPASI